MPASLSDCLNINLKSLKLTIPLLLFPLFFFGQSLTGLWTGVLSNDSNTVRKDQSFEIALTEYKGKVYGYSRSEFIVNDTLYYILKRVKGTIEGDVCEVKDDEIISYNFPTRLDKGIKVISTFYRNKNDSTWHLAGTWKTNATKSYYAVTGKVELQEEKDLNASKIFPHLEELNLANDIAFYKDRKTAPSIVKVIMPEKRTAPLSTYRDLVIVPNQTTVEKAAPITGPAAATEISKNTEPVTLPTITTAEVNNDERPEKAPVITAPVISSINNDTKNINPPVQKTTAPKKTETIVAVTTNADAKKPQTNVVTVPNKNNTAVLTNAPVEKKQTRPDEPVGRVKTEPVTKTIAKQDRPTTIKQPDIASKKPETKNVPVTTATTKTNTEPQKPATIPVLVQTNTVPSKSPVTENMETKTGPVIITNEIKKAAPDIRLKADMIAGRKSDFSQVVNFKSDSLQLSLYDNGEIDGDTVSIFMNGEVIWANQGLKASAIKKTIYLKPGIDDEFTLVMFAENLGKYPPNTGLLVVHDGDDIYNLHFSSDFQMNAGIVFRRKK